MSSGSTHRAGRVVVVSNASTECSGAIAGVLEAAGLEVIGLPDVYSAMGEIAGSRNGVPVCGVVVQADSGCLEASEAEFFALAGRLVPGGRVCVYAGSRGDADLVAAAVAAGAGVLDVASLADWAHRVASPVNAPSGETGRTCDLPVAPSLSRGPVNIPCQEAGEAGGVGFAGASPDRLVAVDEYRLTESERCFPDGGAPGDGSGAEGRQVTEPEVSRDNGRIVELPAEPAAEPGPEGPVPSAEPSIGAAASADQTPAETFTSEKDVAESASAAASGEERARPLQVPPVARPIALSECWGSGASGAGGQDETDAEGVPFVAVPWRPSPNRPARTPPNRNAGTHVRGTERDPEVELTQEELDALLGSNLDEPDSRRKPR